MKSSLWLPVALLGLLAGCGEGKPKVLTLEGSVTIGPAPLASGVVRFTPAGEGVPAAGTVRSGRYKVEAIAPGKYVVAFEATQPSPMIGVPKSSDDRDTAPRGPLPTIPDKYMLGVPVEVTKSDPALNFDLSR